MQQGSVLKNLSASALAEALARIAQIVALALIARSLGSSGVVQVAFAWSIFQLAQPFVQSAPEMVGIRLIAQSENWPRLALFLTRQRLIFAGAAMVLMPLGALIFAPGDLGALQQVLLQTLVLIGTALGNSWVFRGRLWFSAAAWLRVGQAGLFVALTGLALLISSWPGGVALAEAAAALVVAVLGWVWQRRLTAATAPAVPTGGTFAAAEAEPLPADTGLRPLFELGTGALGAMVTWAAIVPLAYSAVPADQAGQLAVATRLALAVVGVVQIGLQVFYPLLARYAGGDRAYGADLAGRLTIYAGVGTLIGVALLAALAQPVVRLVAGPGFERAGTYLIWLASAVVPIAMGSVGGYAMLAMGQIRRSAVIQSVTAVGIVVGCFAGFTLTGSPVGALAVPLVMTVQAVVILALVRRDGMLRLPRLTLALFSPAAIRRLLQER